MRTRKLSNGVEIPMTGYGVYQKDYLDLYLIHEPMRDYYGSWRAMQEMYKEGMIRAICVCNMWPDRMLDLILNADIKPHLHQIETYSFDQQHKANALLWHYQVAQVILR